MYDVCVGLVVKADTDILPEWLSYHIAVGVRHFCIACNDDDPAATWEAVKPFSGKGYVTAFHMPGPAMQLPAYAHILAIIGPQTKWLGFIDSDEFVHLKARGTLGQFLQAYELNDVAALAARWRVFGSSGHTYAQPSVLESYTRCAPDNFAENDHLKSFVRPDRVVGMASPHHATVKPGFRVVDENLVTVPADTPRYAGTADRIRINHYFCRSKEDFIRKMTRGRADVGEARSDWNWFDHMDRNDLTDTDILRRMPAVQAVMKETCGHTLPPAPG